MLDHELPDGLVRQTGKARAVLNTPIVDERPRHILDAAWRLIAERGYHQVRVADIARACGSSTGTVHYYFPGKEDVLQAALRYCVEAAFARQSKLLREVENGRDRLLLLVDLQLPVGEVRDEWSVWLQFWAEASLRPDLRAAHQELYARWCEAVISIIRRGQRQGRFRQDIDPDSCAVTFTSLTDGVAIKVLTGVPGVTIEYMRDSLLTYIQQELDLPQ
jgi:AcrR family transcriptional regulator